MTPTQWREPHTGRAEPATPDDVLDSWTSWLDALEGPGRVAADLLPALAHACGASRGSLMLVNPRTGRLRIMAAVGLPDSMVGQDLVRAPRRISDWVLRERSAVIVNGEVSDQRFEGSAMRDYIASAMSIPIPGPHGPIGVLNLARVSPAPVFGPDDLARMESVTARAAALLGRTQTLVHAITDQRVLAGRARPVADATWSGTRSCRFAVAKIESIERAGDRFERVAHPDGGLTLMLADLFGSGAVAQRVGELTRGLFLAHARYHRSPAEIVRRIHESLLQDVTDAHACLWVACISPNGQLTSCSAGYPAAICLPTDGVVGQRLTAGGPPAGVATERHAYQEDRLRLLPGDAVVVVSDGVLGVVSANGATFGVERVEDLLHEYHRQPLDHLVRRVNDEALAFGGIAQPVDDLVVLGVRFSRED